MFTKTMRIVFMPVVIWALIALSVPAHPADNAVITGDGVRVRDLPSIWGDISSVLNKGARVEVIAKTELADTINGLNAPWYKISNGKWVFGGFVSLDAGAEASHLSLESGDPDLISRFIMEALYTFGENRSDIVRNLGRPISETKERSPLSEEGEDSFLYKMVYDGAVVEVCEWDGTGCILSMNITTGAYEFDGVTVGSSISDVRHILGAPHGESADKDKLFYYGRPYHYLFFKTDSGKITEITFVNSMCGD